MARNLRRYTNTKYPSKPTTSVAIKNAYNDRATMEEYGMNMRKTYNFYIDTVVESKHGEFTLFASYETDSLIEKYIPPGNRKYMLDGTFDVTPIGDSYQLLIIAIEFKTGVSYSYLIFKCI